MLYQVETDRRPCGRIWFGSLEDTVAGLELHTRVRMKPFMLHTAPQRWVRVDVEEILYLEAQDGHVDWVTVRGVFPDLDSPDLEHALARASRCGVFVRLSPRHAVAPARIRGICPGKDGGYLLETEGPRGEPMFLSMEPQALAAVEECLDALALGGGLLMQEIDEGADER